MAVTRQAEQRGYSKAQEVPTWKLSSLSSPLSSSLLGLNLAAIRWGADSRPGMVDDHQRLSQPELPKRST